MPDDLELPAEVAVEEAQRHINWRQRAAGLTADVRRDAATVAVIAAVALGLIFNGVYISMIKRQVDENTLSRLYMEKRVEEALQSHTVLKHSAEQEIKILREIDTKIDAVTVRTRKEKR